jgi:hypothetical protein
VEFYLRRGRQALGQALISSITAPHLPMLPTTHPSSCLRIDETVRGPQPSFQRYPTTSFKSLRISYPTKMSNVLASLTDATSKCSRVLRRVGRYGCSFNRPFCGGARAPSERVQSEISSFTLLQLIQRQHTDRVTIPMPSQCVLCPQPHEPFDTRLQLRLNDPSKRYDTQIRQSSWITYTSPLLPRRAGLC